MKYNFDEYVERRNTKSVKWDGMKEVFGTEDALSMWVADMDFLSPPEVVNALIERAKHGVYGYTLKDEGFYNSFINWIKKRHNWEIERKWIVATPGVVSAISLAILAFTKPSDEIILQPPVYYPFFRVVSGLGRKIVYNPLKFENGKYTMDFDDLERKINGKTKMLILCSPQNPTGRVWTEEELSKLGNICKRNDILIASDEIHADIVYKEYKHTPIASLSDFANNTITFMAPSKTFNVAGLNTAMTIIQNEELLKSFSMMLENMGLGIGNVFGITASQAAYENGEEWLEALLDYLKENLEFLKLFVAERMPQVKIVEPEGTYLVWLDFRSLNMSDEELRTFMLEKAKVALDDGYIFGPGGSGFQRINIATPRKLLKEGLERMEKALNSLLSEKAGDGES
ncbi:MalY/PatB family protein [Mesoaciditoga lauensis]|uniref:MalY/PatB family protein n=1 Tax=Mesoaciditoga lauensis TaxID=1495039 RepID=UPI00055D4F3C|nr:MalY/PatB family protein [Mesoaciditoga lauensis]